MAAGWYVPPRWLKPGQIAAHGGWDLWRLREVGGWGDAGRIVGLRWEEVGGAAALAAFGEHLLPLWLDRALGRWLGTVGLPNADALLIEAGGDGGLTLRSVDLKWTLDTADYSQISGATLRRLVERAGRRLTDRFPGQEGDWRYGDGLFVSPDRPLNRIFLDSELNREREYPIEQREVHWVRVDVPAFLRPLPGWSMAERLAALERTEPSRDLESAERFYFLGVGVRGALLAAERSLFAERENLTDERLVRIDEAEDARALARLERLLAERRPATAREVVSALAGGQAARQELRQQLRGLERSPYRFGDFQADAARQRRGGPEGDEAAVAALRAIYKEVGRAHAAAVRARGRELVADGDSDPTALEQLRAESDIFKRRAQAQARALLGEPAA
ncbi:MAG TPA: hypothetical protein VGL23_13560 [Chloroflexota bacterium]